MTEKSRLRFLGVEITHKLETAGVYLLYAAAVVASVGLLGDAIIGPGEMINPWFGVVHLGGSGAGLAGLCIGTSRVARSILWPPTSPADDLGEWSA